MLSIGSSLTVRNITLRNGFASGEGIIGQRVDGWGGQIKVPPFRLCC